MENRLLKDSLYEQVARIGKAVSSPKRLEMLEMLAQGEKTVEALAEELSIDVKLTSAHLRSLKEARLVIPRREGRYIRYRLAGSDVASLLINLRDVAEEYLVELKLALHGMVNSPAQLTAVGRTRLLEQAERGEVVVIDVRPASEYDVAHLPFARSMPLAELEYVFRNSRSRRRSLPIAADRSVCCPMKPSSC